jgi:hypothetical protein
MKNSRLRPNANAASISFRKTATGGLLSKLLTANSEPAYAIKCQDARRDNRKQFH